MSSSKQSFSPVSDYKRCVHFKKKQESEHVFCSLGKKEKEKPKRKKKKGRKSQPDWRNRYVEFFFINQKSFFFLQFSQRGNQNCKKKSFLYFPYFLTFKKSRRSVKYIHLSFRTYGIFLYPNVLFYFQFSQKKQSKENKRWHHNPCLFLNTKRDEREKCACQCFQCETSDDLVVLKSL